MENDKMNFNTRYVYLWMLGNINKPSRLPSNVQIAKEIIEHTSIGKPLTRDRHVPYGWYVDPNVFSRVRTIRP